jgi:hypothetical protein
MRYWTTVTPRPETGEPVYETFSEKEIFSKHWEEWSAKMIAKYGQEQFDRGWIRQECIEDWVTLNCAWESSESH